MELEAQGDELEPGHNDNDPDPGKLILIQQYLDLLKTVFT